MGLILPYEKMWDMPLGGISKEKQVPHWFGNIALVIVGAIFKVFFRYRVDHVERLRKFKDKSGVLIVCNHTSFLDVVMIYLAVRPKQWVRLMGRDTLFDNAGGFVGQVLSRVGGFPIKRDQADKQAIKRATRMLKNCEVVAILPEGTRRGKGTTKVELHSGASFIARMGHVPILPMTVRNVENIKRKGERFRFPKVTVEFGEPILVGDFDFLPKDERLEACTWYAMRQCFSMFYYKKPEDVDMAELFPETKDYSHIFEEHPIPQHTSDEVVAGIMEQKALKGAASKAPTKMIGACDDKVVDSKPCQDNVSPEGIA